MQTTGGLTLPFHLLTSSLQTPTLRDVPAVLGFTNGTKAQSCQQEGSGLEEAKERVTIDAAISQVRAGS